MKEMFIETVKIENSVVLQAGRHTERMRDCGMLSQYFDFQSLQIPAEFAKGVVKCSILYSDKIESVNYSIYSPRPIRRLKLVECDSIDYSRKYADRRALEALREKREECDDVLIVKNGLITDTSYSNIVFFDGREYFTPDSFLLNGCKRRELLESGRIKQRRITAAQMQEFLCAYMINAMLDMEDNPFPIEIIR